MNRLLKPEIGHRDFGSAYDPVLCGVAQGLARLFPPVEGALPGGIAADALPRQGEDRPADGRQVACRSGRAKETERA